MTSLSSCRAPGVLLVLAQPTSERYLQDFHDWYDTEHGPARLRLGKRYFLNGYRYKAADAESIWLAIYDMENLSAGADPTYTYLREHRSLREQEVFRHKMNVLSRQFLKLESETGPGPNKAARTLCIITFEVPDDSAERLVAQYIDQIFNVAKEQNACSRSRLFRLIDGHGMSSGYNYYVGIHDLDGGARDNAEQPLLAAVQSLLQRVSGASPAKLQMYNFYREFHADDYSAPDVSENVKPRHDCDCDTSKL